MPLHVVDPLRVVHELVDIKTTLLSPIPDGPGDPVAWNSLKRSVKRLRALLPSDPDMADGVSTFDVERLLKFLDELTEEWQLAGGEGELGVSDDRTFRMLQRLIVSFSPAAQPPEVESVDQSLSLLDRYPATPEGHVEFMEFVLREVHSAAQATRRPPGEEYPNATLEKMVEGICVMWPEAKARMSLLRNPPTGGFKELAPGIFGSVLSVANMRLDANVVQPVEEVLQRRLTIGTVDQIAELLAPVIRALRDEWEHTYNSAGDQRYAIVNTAGDLWKSFSEGKNPGVVTSAFSMKPRQGNTPDIKHPKGNDQQKWGTLDVALLHVKREGGDKAAAMEKLLADVALARGISFDDAINMPLAEFVRALEDGNASGEQPNKTSESVDPVRNDEREANDGAPQVDGQPEQGNLTDHSPDFRSVRWYGVVYSFTANQAFVVKMLYENWQNGTPDVGDGTLLLAVDHAAPPERMSNLFRDHSAWGTMIVAGGTRGTHRLTKPAEEKP